MQKIRILCRRSEVGAPHTGIEEADIPKPTFRRGEIVELIPRTTPLEKYPGTAPVLVKVTQGTPDSPNCFCGVRLNVGGVYGETDGSYRRDFIKDRFKLFVGTLILRCSLVFVQLDTSEYETGDEGDKEYD